MKGTPFLILLLISSGSSLNKGRGRPRHVEIAYGSKVDYRIMKLLYPFMARIVLDGNERCGGSVIAER